MMMMKVGVMNTTVFCSSRLLGHSVGSDGFKNLLFSLSQGDSWGMVTIRPMKAGVMPAQPCSLAPVYPSDGFFVFVCF